MAIDFYLFLNLLTTISLSKELMPFVVSNSIDEFRRKAISDSLTDCGLVELALGSYSKLELLEKTLYCTLFVSFYDQIINNHKISFFI